MNHVKYVKLPSKRWTWIVYNGNNQAIAGSLKNYSRLSDAKKAFKRLF